MPINLESLQEIYNKPDQAKEHNYWISIGDSKEGTLTANAIGSSGGNPGNGWKIHISIDPAKMAQAALLIAQELNNPDAPRVSIKMAGKKLAVNGQPSKQIAFLFYSDELNNPVKITAFLNHIESILISKGIGQDPRPINSDEEQLGTKYDARILDNEGKPSRFNYRNEDCIVLEDELFLDVSGAKDFEKQETKILVKQSYYLTLPNTQKHNPGQLVADPFKAIRLQSQKSEYDQLEIEFRQFLSNASQELRHKHGHISTEEYWNNLTTEGKQQQFEIFRASFKPKVTANQAFFYQQLPLEFRQFLSEKSQEQRHEGGHISTEEFWMHLELPQQKDWLKAFENSFNDQALNQDKKTNCTIM